MSYMGDNCLRVERHANGFEVTVKDPAIVKANQKRDADNSKPGTKYTPWQDPNRTFVFIKEDDVLKFIKANLSKIIPEADTSFDSSFELATAEDD